MRDRLAAVRDRIGRAAARAGRRSEDVTLIAVSKTFPASAVREAYDAGLREFGENKVQEAEAKLAGLQDLRARGARFHLIGHLQTNKARKAVAAFDRIHSVDSIELGMKLEHYAAVLGRTLHVLVQVDLGREATKTGLDEAHLHATLEQLRGCKSVRVDGLMTLPPFTEDPEGSRPFFARLRELRDRASREGLLLGVELSMGMSHDLEVAIEEGATLVRVGTALFGERKKA
jgi:PLP dependent protein